MKDLSREFLIESLSKYQIRDRYDVNALFRLFCSIELTSYQDVSTTTREFFTFLKQNLNLNENRQVKCAVESAESILTPMMTKSTFNSPEKEFAEMVLQLSPTNACNAHILDVGPGKMPYSSLTMAQEAKKVTAMDKEFIFTIESLKAMNVDALEYYFTETTPVADYDFIVGRCPCSAIGHIVSQCYTQNKPYFIELCNCNVPNRKTYLRDNNGEEIYTWKNVLPDIDPNIKFFDNYAFNLDASPEQVRRVIQDIHRSISMPSKFSNLKQEKRPVTPLVDPNELDLSLMFSGRRNRADDMVPGFDWE